MRHAHGDALKILALSSLFFYPREQANTGTVPPCSQALDAAPKRPSQSRARSTGTLFAANDRRQQAWRHVQSPGPSGSALIDAR
jgi:hypothetical protein